MEKRLVQGNSYFYIKFTANLLQYLFNHGKGGKYTRSSVKFRLKRHTYISKQEFLKLDLGIYSGTETVVQEPFSN